MTEPLPKAPPAAGETLKIISFNVNSLPRSWSKGLKAYIASTSPDILCLQGTEVSVESPNTFHLPGYCAYFAYPAAAGGGLGSSIYSKIRPISARLGFDDSEGRVLVLEFTKFTVLSVLAPSAGADLENLRAKVDEWNPKVAALAAELQAAKPVIIAGDFKVAHKELDIYDAADREGAAGFTADERAWFSGLLDSGFVDVFREKHPDLQEFTYFGRRFGRRGRGKGWRLDYFLVAKGGLAAVVDCTVDTAPTFVERAPIVLTVDRGNFLTEADAVVQSDVAEVIVVNTGEAVPPGEAPEVAKRPRKKLGADDVRAIREGARTSERARKPVKRDEFEEGDEKPKKTKVNFDDEEYGRPIRKHKKVNKTPK
jgi:exodeoxyribonuclease-3